LYCWESGTITIPYCPTGSTSAARAARLAFGGKLRIHPWQLAPVMRGFAQTAEPVQQAARVLSLSRLGGSGAQRVDGQMVDKPVIDRARALLPCWNARRAGRRADGGAGGVRSGKPRRYGTVMHGGTDPCPRRKSHVPVARMPHWPAASTHLMLRRTPGPCSPTASPAPKDSKAAACITRALARSGFGVLRSDFTSLGSSERITPAALRVLLHEYRIGFPVGVDMPGESGPLPRTMRAHQLGGTPSLLVFDRTGQLRLNQLGQVDDLPLGALLGELLAQSS